MKIEVDGWCLSVPDHDVPAIMAAAKSHYEATCLLRDGPSLRWHQLSQSKREEVCQKLAVWMWITRVLP